MKKRSLTDEVINEERKRSKQEVIQKMYGDGSAWFRCALIGKGSFGSVFIANLKFSYTYSMYPSIMAVKSAEYSVSGSIQKEKQVLDNIGYCPNIITSFGEEVTVNENGQMVYNLLLEYASGGTLNDLIKKSNGKGLGEYDVRRYTRSILRGLSCIHEKGYVHCDLKPDNVLLVKSYGKGGGFIAKIGDFGSANRAKQNKGQYLEGTLRYLSPEAVNEGVQGQPGDIWAVGCIVFEMLTGRPFLCLDDVLSSYISEEGRSFLKKCLSKRVMSRLTANMLLKHSFLQGLLGDEDDEVEGSEHDVFDINAITSVSSSFFDDSDDDNESCSSSGSDEFEEIRHDRFLHEVQQFPVSLAVCKGV